MEGKYNEICAEYSWGWVYERDHKGRVRLRKSVEFFSYPWLAPPRLFCMPKAAPGQAERLRVLWRGVFSGEQHEEKSARRIGRLGSRIQTAGTGLEKYATEGRQARLLREVNYINSSGFAAVVLSLRCHDCFTRIVTASCLAQPHKANGSGDGRAHPFPLLCLDQRTYPLYFPSQSFFIHAQASLVARRITYSWVCACLGGCFTQRWRRSRFDCARLIRAL